MRRGVRLAVDPGKVRIGVAVSDADGMLAVPLETVSATGDPYQRLTELVSEHSVIEVLVGLPLSMSGGEGPAAEQARAFARRLADRLPVPVRLLDERLSTVSAGRTLRSAGRSTRSSRQVIDQAAAVVLLQGALDGERSTGRTPGVPVADPSAEDGR